MQQLENREIHYDGIHCSLTLEQLTPTVIVLKISGSDVGEFGEAPMAALDEWFTRNARIEFFIDARGVRGASISVSGEWARWLRLHKSQLQSIIMLTGSRFIQITAEFVRRFADLEGIMWICTEPAVFDGALREAVRRG